MPLTKPEYCGCSAAVYGPAGRCPKCGCPICQACAAKRGSDNRCWTCRTQAPPNMPVDPRRPG
jgi:hypothetical protein